MAGEELPKEVQHSLMQLQLYQNQLQSLRLQKQQLELQLTEIESAEKALSEEKGGDVYRAVGPLLLKSSRETVETKLAESKQVIELRMKALEKQESRVKERTRELAEKISPHFRDHTGALGG